MVCDDLIRQSQGLKILSTEQCKGQGLNLRKSQAETLKQSLIAQQVQEQHVYINIDSNASDNEENKDNNVNSNEVERPPYDNNDEVEVGGAQLCNLMINIKSLTLRCHCCCCRNDIGILITMPTRNTCIYTEKELPQPHFALACGLLTLKYELPSSSIKSRVQSSINF